MKTKTVLLVEWGPECESASNLAEILRFCGAGSKFHLRRFLAKPSKFIERSEKPTTAPAPSPADMAFFILPSAGRLPLADCIKTFRKTFGATPIVVALPTEDLSEATKALHLDVQDCVTAPFRPVDILRAILRFTTSRPQWTSVSSLDPGAGLNQFVGRSPVLLAALKRIRLAAASSANVLICGETGTGKELGARAVHSQIARCHKTFGPLNCSLEAGLLENQLFGHARGAFTSADDSTLGLVHDVEGGTLFLDDIDCLHNATQPKFLRFVQFKEFRAVGSAKLCTANVRFIASTNVDLEGAVRAQRFREDLYYRLSVITITLPPLRARREDIPLLAVYFLNRFATSTFPAKTLTANAMRKLLRYDWPGNVRQLENIIESAVALSESPSISAAEIEIPAAGVPVTPAITGGTMAELKRSLAIATLKTCKGNGSKAADILGIHRTSMWRLTKKGEPPRPTA